MQEFSQKDGGPDSKLMVITGDHLNKTLRSNRKLPVKRSHVCQRQHQLKLRDYLQQAAVNEGGEHKCQVVVHQIRPEGDKSTDVPHSGLLLTLIPFY